MSQIGPKNPNAARDASRMEEMLARLRARQGQAAEGTPEAAPTAPATSSDAFRANAARAHAAKIGGQASLLPTPVATGRGVMNLRLNALTGQGLPSQTGGPTGQAGVGGPERARVVDTPQGKVIQGSVLVETAADLALLKGAVAVDGNLEIAESALAGKDLLAALHGLQVVGGNLALEGNRALEALTALGALRQVEGSLYLGFNEGLTEARLPALESIGRALILEGNPSLVSLELPRLTSITGYLHLHENDELVSVKMPALAELTGELSIVDNPKLLAVELPALAAPGGGVEIEQNGATRLRGLSPTH